MMALEGLKVLDFSRLLPGPYCTWLLGDMGADIIRVENPREVEKQAKVFGWDRLTEAERVAIRRRDVLARNKRSILLDLGSTAAQKALVALAADVDVVVEDYRPGVLDSLGLGYEDLKAVNPRLVYCSLTLCGQHGPYRDKPGHDPIALAISGAGSRVGENPDAPGFAGIPAADIVTGTHAAFGILAALRARDRDGEGQHVDIAMSDCSMTLTVNLLSRHADLSAIPPRGNRRADTGIWRTADGKFLCTTDMEPRYWRTFCETVGRPDFIPLQLDLASRPMIRRELEATFATRTLAAWMAILEAAGTQYAPVLSVKEAMDDPHNRARGMVHDTPLPEGGSVRQLGVPIKLSRTPGTVRSAAPVSGADTRSVLASLGLAPGEIDRLLQDSATGRIAAT